MRGKLNCKIDDKIILWTNFFYNGLRTDSLAAPVISLSMVWKKSYFVGYFCFKVKHYCSFLAVQ